MVPDVVVVDHHDSYTWNLVHLVASVTGVLPTLVGDGTVPPPRFAERYRNYFDRDLRAFPAFLVDNAAPAADVAVSIDRAGRTNSSVA